MRILPSDKIKFRSSLPVANTIESRNTATIMRISANSKKFISNWRLITYEYIIHLVFDHFSYCFIYVHSFDSQQFQVSANLYSQ